MSTSDLNNIFGQVGDGSGLSHQDMIYPEELALAFRNRGMLLEALAYDITPTGMHYLLTHFDVPNINSETWSLSLKGLFKNPTTFQLSDLLNRPKVTMPVTLECAGNGRAKLHPRPISQPWLLEAIGTAEWTGTPLKYLLQEAQIDDRAVELVFTGRDQGIQGGEIQFYQRSLTIDEAMRSEVLLSYEMNGAPLEPQHGFPLRLIVPGWYGMTSVKWLDSIEAVSEPFMGYQMDKTYRYATSREELGERVSTMRVRALMSPPGIPEFMTRGRLLNPGLTRVIGRAWAGPAKIEKVEFSSAAGQTWNEGILDKPVGEFAWTGWHFDWTATSGKHKLSVRATDEKGNVQPIQQPWTAHGMGNNMAQEVDVIVT